jgi:hypothetical protein
LDDAQVEQIEVEWARRVHGPPSGNGHASARDVLLRTIVALALVVGTAGAAEIEAVTHERSEFMARVQPLLKTYCYSCHDAEKHRGGLVLSELSAPVAQDNLPRWTDVSNVLDVASMPPEGRPQPTSEERGLMLAWVKAAMARFHEQSTETNGDTLLKRISNRAYRNMVTTLLGVPSPLIDRFPSDGAVEGFDTVGSGLVMTANQAQLYFDNARQAFGLLDVAQLRSPKPEAQTWTYQQWMLDDALQRNEVPAKLAACIAGGPLAARPGDERVGWDIAGALIQHYHVTKWPDVTAEWWREPDGLQVVRDVAKQCADRVAQWQKSGFVDTLTVPYTEGDAGDNFFEFTAPVSGWYVVNAKLWNSDPVFLIPARFRIDRSIVTRLLPDPAHPDPRTYEARVFITAGRHRVGCGVDWFGWTDYGPRMSAWGKDVHAACIHMDDFRIHGPLFEEWPPRQLATIFFKGPDAPPTRDYAQEIIARFMQRAEAGMVDTKAAATYADLVMSRYAKTNDFPDAIELGLSMVLSSPRFLYLAEEARVQPGVRRPLTGPELARRLAYALWSDLPDDVLTHRASGHSLQQDDGLRQEVDRLLSDPRSRSFREAFVTQWLRLDRLGGIVFPYAQFPKADSYLKQVAVEESIAFFSELLDHDLSVLNLVDSDFAMLNWRLADLYGVPGVTGGDLRRVALPPGCHRGGVLTQASVLMSTSNGMLTSPVKRGLLVLERILGDSPGAPPPNVPAIDRISLAHEDGTPFSPRERLEAHRQNMSCARCHSRIDPPGLALENFDPTGQWIVRNRIRLPDAKAPGGVRSAYIEIVAAGQLADGSAFADVDEFKRRLAEHQEVFVRTLVQDLMVYLLGRELQGSDRPVIDAIVKDASTHGLGLHRIVEDAILSTPFRTK